MKYNKCYLVLVLFVILAYLVQGCQNQLQRGQVFEKRSIVLGKIDNENKISVSIKFHNIFDEKLIFHAIRPSCGCISAFISKIEYKPSEKGELRITVDPEGYSGDFRKTIYIRTNIPEYQMIVLEIIAYIDAPIIASTGYLGFGKIKFGETVSKTVRLKRGTAPNFSVLAINIPKTPGNLSYNIRMDAEDEYNIDFVFKPYDGNFRIFNEVICIETDIEEMPEIYIEIRGTITGDIEYNPKNIDIQLLKGSYFNYSLSLTSNQEFYLKDILLNLSQKNILKFRQTTLSEGHNFSIILYSDKPILTSCSGNLEILTSLESQSKIIIPIHIIVQDGK